MELIKYLLDDSVPAIGLTKFKGQKFYREIKMPKTNYNKLAFKPNYSNNIFVL